MDMQARAKELLYHKPLQQSWGARRAAKDKKYRASSTYVQDYVVLDFETTGFRAGGRSNYSNWRH